jgi:hypothetical protein
MKQLIKKILDCIENPMCKEVSVHYYPDGEIAFEVFESGLPIVYTREKELVIPADEIEIGKLDIGILKELNAIMQVILDNMEDIIIED